MSPAPHSLRYINLRLIIYHVLKRLFIAALIIFAVRFLFCDSVVLKTEHMEPTLLNGDRVILLRTPFIKPWSSLFPRRLNDCVIFDIPLRHQVTGCLRIAGLPGDTVQVVQGSFFRTGIAPINSGKPAHEELLPEDYSPRDFLLPYHIPKPGDTLVFTSLSMRDLVFTYSLMRQENPNIPYTLDAKLVIDDSISNDYFIKDFPLYTGQFDTIPDSLISDWFFWDRLLVFLESTMDGKSIEVRLSVRDNDTPVSHYCIKERVYFVLADNWCNGYDSRYFGPIVASLQKGKVIGILWSFAPSKRTKVARGRRIGKIIR